MARQVKDKHARRWRWLLAAFSLLLLFAGFIAWERWCAARTADNVQRLRLAINTYMVRDRLRSYPPSIDALLEGGELQELPVNPYTLRTVRLLLPTDRPAPGEMVYLTEISSPVRGAPSVVSKYALVAYGLLPLRRFNPTWYVPGIENIHPWRIGAIAFSPDNPERERYQRQRLRRDHAPPTAPGRSPHSPR